MFCPKCGVPVKPYSTTATTEQKTNIFAVLGLIFSILGGWLGIVFSIIGLVQAPKFGGKGKGLAIAGLIISVIWVVIAIAMYPFVLAAMENALA